MVKYLIFASYPLLPQTTVLESERRTDGQKVTITVTLTRVVPSDDCLQLLNIIFRRQSNQPCHSASSDVTFYLSKTIEVTRTELAQNVNNKLNLREVAV